MSTASIIRRKKTKLEKKSRGETGRKVEQIQELNDNDKENRKRQRTDDLPGNINYDYYVDLTELDDSPIIQKSIKNKICRLVKKFEEEKEEAEKRTILEDNLKFRWETKEHRQSMLRLENTGSVRGALEYVRSKILLNNSFPTFEEPIDKTLLRLSQDQNFLSYLQKMCHENQLRIEDIRRCIGGLYHTASKNFHGHGKIIINSSSWSANEVLSLGVIFEYFKIEWSYHNADGLWSGVERKSFTSNEQI
ncbi:9190_t:CDS:2, partial [Funneliformis mosseae]